MAVSDTTLPIGSVTHGKDYKDISVRAVETDDQDHPYLSGCPEKSVLMEIAVRNRAHCRLISRSLHTIVAVAFAGESARRFKNFRENATR
jgi:hypothetical protein